MDNVFRNEMGPLPNDGSIIWKGDSEMGESLRGRKIENSSIDVFRWKA